MVVLAQDAVPAIGRVTDYRGASGARLGRGEGGGCIGIVSRDQSDRCRGKKRMKFSGLAKDRGVEREMFVHPSSSDWSSCARAASVKIP